MSTMAAAADKSMAKLESNMALARSKTELFAKYSKGIGLVGNVDISDIDVSQNIRKTPIDKNSTAFLQLKKSIERDGLLQNVVVELRAEEGLVCLAGHRRIEALRELGQERVRALILDERKANSVSAALSENQNREGLHFLDIADGYAELKAQGWNIEDLSAHYERDKKTLERYLKLAAFDSPAKKMIRENPDKLSLRTVLHEFVNKKFETPRARYKAIEQKIKDKGQATPRLDKSSELLAKLIEYHKERNLSSEEQKLTFDLLRYLKILK